MRLRVHLALASPTARRRLGKPSRLGKLATIPVGLRLAFPTRWWGSLCLMGLLGCDDAQLVESEPDATPTADARPDEGQAGQGGEGGQGGAGGEGGAGGDGGQGGQPGPGGEGGGGEGGALEECRYDNHDWDECAWAP